MKIKGHSNFKVELLQEKGKFFVRKSCLKEKDNERLHKQYLKQWDFSYGLEGIIVPQTQKFNKTSNLHYFDMEYLNGLNFAELFEKKNFKCIEKYFNKIIYFIEYTLEGSTNEDVTELIKEKYQNTKNNILLNNVKFDFTKTDNMFNSLKDVVFPIGYNHGDLTLSNILFDENENNIVFIDFLDCFIDTPFNDIVKLRQDTQFKWSVLLLEEKRDITKLNIILDKLDQIVESTFSKLDFYKKYYQMFQILNLLRVLQYAKDEFIIDHLRNLTFYF